MIKGLCIDVAGVLTQGDQALPGAIDALDRLKAEGVPFRLLTNTSRTPPGELLANLTKLGFRLQPHELITAPDAICQRVRDEKLHPWYLVHPAIQGLFPPSRPNGAFDTIVVCDAGEGFGYAALNQAFRLLLEGARFLAIGRNRYFRDSTGLQLDAGPFIEALRYASGREPEWIGKPGPALFQAASHAMDLPFENLLMIGDDVGADNAGAHALGMPSVLVQTGKYQTGDEHALPPDGRMSRDFRTVVTQLLSGLPAIP